MSHTYVKMNVNNAVTEQVEEMAARIAAIRKEKTRTLEEMRNAVPQNTLAIEQLEYYITSMKKEIEDRRENPLRYPIGAGAGTIEYVERSIQDYMNKIAYLRTQEKNAHLEIEERSDEFDQEIDDVEETRDQLLHVIADKIGLENLKNERTLIGKEMSKYNRLQREAYELQKERYENCKSTFGFRPDDRDFIETHKALNEQYKNTWNELSRKRDQLCELIDTLDSADIDDGFDEFEDS
jgi:hypothetical protein